MADKELLPNENDENTTNRLNNGDPEAEEPQQQLELDLGDDLMRKPESNRLGNHNTNSGPSSDVPRREDNPFSFKHFLRSDSGGNSYQNKGAKPKVYCENRLPPSCTDYDFPPSAGEVNKQNRIVPEFSSALPDFVQDHLIVEQCYLGNQVENFNLDIENLPDFTPSRNRAGARVANSENTLGFNRPDNIDLSIPLDLPVRPQAGFPLDLPMSSTPQDNNLRNSQTIGEVGVSKSLPDFLADGAVRGQDTDNLSSTVSPERETERLRHELEVTKRQLSDQTRRVELLNRELELAKNKEHDYTQNLIKALEQVEENLERSNKRAANAENTIVKLRQEIKSLMAQISKLKLENKNLKGEEGAVGGVGYFTPPNEIQSQRLAQELRNAASSAEHSLRQLLTGVDNLRIMAASLENMHRIEEEKTESFLDLDDEAGPAL